ncbi:hypothetical protein AUJ87_03520 [Candidatus Gracilibacteria bacterium CG1_02_38_174]|nr:MAG: hypothetical protein AUJ87_03520 [Candidatus Gracilibacteria bacterium CG1_02_38_174]PIZ02021.1 MAG: hypothetical protein COY60_00495 [Candidatus Gracilibacteria bacterium CG_4_10_14_0_8_um_filter_38_28]
MLDSFFVLFFLGIGVYLYRYYYSMITFNKQQGYFYKGTPKMVNGFMDSNDSNVIPLSSIYAIQIIAERVSGKNSSFHSYEINLVLDGKKRVNVVDHGNLIAIEENSKKLSEYLGVPVWDISKDMERYI